MPAPGAQLGAEGLLPRPDQLGLRRAAHLLQPLQPRAAGGAAGDRRPADDGGLLRSDYTDRRGAALRRAAAPRRRQHLQDPRGGLRRVS